MGNGGADLDLVLFCVVMRFMADLVSNGTWLSVGLDLPDLLSQKQHKVSDPDPTMVVLTHTTHPDLLSLEY